MPHGNNTDGRKPYKRYKAGRARRSLADDRLMNAAPALSPAPHREYREASPPRTSSSQQASPAYRRYSVESQGNPPAPAPPAGAKPRPSRRRRWWTIPVGALLLLAIAGIVATVIAWPGYRQFDRAVDKSNDRIDADTRAQLTQDEGAIWRKGTTILLLGVDSKDGEPARSDTIMLLRFNPLTRTMNQLSIPRDTRVTLPNGTQDKINAAMFWGGSAMAVEAVKDYLGIDVNHVMVVNFQGFPRLVNAVGGVDINVPKTVTTVAGSTQRTVVFKEGWQHMDGKYAMLYVRIRYADDDIHRAERQQQFVQALQKKIAQPSNITKLPEIGKHFMSGVDTDLTTNEILELGLLRYITSGGKHSVLSGTPGWEGGISYIYPPSDAEKKQAVEAFLTK